MVHFLRNGTAAFADRVEAGYCQQRECFDKVSDCYSGFAADNQLELAGAAAVVVVEAEAAIDTASGCPWR